MRFTAEREAERTRARFRHPRRADRGIGHLPGILHIHGGGQTASLDWVRFWATARIRLREFRFHGPLARTQGLHRLGADQAGELAEANGGLLVRPTARASSWYHWALVARRALTVLSYHPKVDRDRLGIFGVSVGGTLVLARRRHRRPREDRGADLRLRLQLRPAENRLGLPRTRTRRRACSSGSWLRRDTRLVDSPSDAAAGRHERFSRLDGQRLRNSRRKFAARRGWRSRRATTTISTKPKATICRRGWIGNCETARRFPPSRNSNCGSIMTGDPVADVRPADASRVTKSRCFTRWAKNRRRTGSGVGRQSVEIGTIVAGQTARRADARSAARPSRTSSTNRAFA